jgi:PAS domain S-box-containing protein
MPKNSQSRTPSDDQFRGLAEAMPQVVWTADPDGGLDFTNKRWHEYSGMDADASRGWGWANAVHADDLAQASQIWLSCLQSGLTYEVEFRLKGADGNYRWHLARAVPIRDENGQIAKWFGTCTDIEDQKRAAELLEERVQRRTNEVKKAHAELQQMAYALSHELQAPLLKITSDLGLLKVRYSDRLGEDADGFMTSAVSNASAVQSMLDGLWIYARIDKTTITKELCDCSEILGKVLIRLEPLIQERKAKITKDKLSSVQANEPQLEYMFQQLLENALKHSGSKLVNIHCAVKEHDGDWIFSISDDGPGFDMMEANHIFKMFQRLNKEVSGTGMGLAVCKRIADAHGGDVWAKSEPGRGSTFYFTIPK